MAILKIDFQHKLVALDSGKPLSLADATGQSSLVLLHFWSPWSEECAASLGDFIATSNELARNGIAVVSILAESNPEALTEATAFAKEAGKKAAGHWVLDEPTAPLSRDLRVLNLPTFALVHKDGSVLFNGHPAEPELWEVLKKAAPKVNRPEVAPPADGIEDPHDH